MKQQLQIVIGLCIMVASALIMTLSSPMLALADTPQKEICNGIGLTTADGQCGDNGAQVNHVLAVVINLLSVVIGVVAVIMIVVAGFRFITSGGDTAKVAGAKNTIIYALIGLVVVVLAQVIVRFVLSSVK